MATKFNTRFAHTRQSGIEFTQPSLTEQQFGYECDINRIVKGFTPPNVNSKQPLFGIKVTLNQFIDAMNIIADAKSKFEELPSHIRSEFGNDPKKLIEFINDDKNYERAVELGLIEKKAEKFPLTPQEPSTVITATPQPVITEVSSQ